jgi:hypothetical protein
MMAIPRLPEAASDFVLTVTIPKKLRPYFEHWYQATKKPGDTPESFAFRLLKQSAVRAYATPYVQADIKQVEADKQAAAEAVGQDLSALEGEVE